MAVALARRKRACLFMLGEVTAPKCYHQDKVFHKLNPSKIGLLQDVFTFSPKLPPPFSPPLLPLSTSLPSPLSPLPTVLPSHPPTKPSQARRKGGAKGGGEKLGGVSLE